MPLKPIYTEPENCQDCYKCIRECPVKAIRIEDNKAYIIEERCIYCGHCTQVCPTEAKKVRDGISRARMTLEKFPKVILSLAPCRYPPAGILRRIRNGSGCGNRICKSQPASANIRPWNIHILYLPGNGGIYPKIFGFPAPFAHSGTFSHAITCQIAESTLRRGYKNSICRTLYL